MAQTPLAERNSVQLPAALDLGRLMRATSAPLDFVLPGFKRGTVGGLVSPGGVGKSYWALSVAVALACERLELAGFDAVPGSVLMLSSEDPEDILAQRLQALRAHLPGKVALRPLDYRSCLGLNIDLMDTRWFEQICAAAQGVRLVILDTLTRFHALDENDAGDMRRLLGRLEQLASESGAAVLYLHHTSKAAILNGQGGLQQAARGSSVLVDNARWVSFLAVMSEGEAREAGLAPAERLNYVRWNISKQNYGAPLPDTWYRRVAGGVLVPVELTWRKPGGYKPAVGAALPLPEEASMETNRSATATQAYNGNW